MAGKISTEQVIDAYERSTYGLENIGICTACGYEQDGCEPDAENYECEDCGEHRVQGTMNLLMGIAF